MRPSFRSNGDCPKSGKKNWSGFDKREVIERGAAQLGWDLEKLLTLTLQAMAESEDEINAKLQEA